MAAESRSDFAKRLGVNKSTVTRYAQAGRLVEKDGRVLVEESLAKIAATQGHRGDVAARHAKIRGAEIPAPQQDGKNASKEAGQVAGEEDALPPAGGRQRYQTLELHYENQQIKLEMALRRGLRFPREAVKREASGIGSTIRAALERLIDLTAPQLAAERSDTERARLIRIELKRVRWMVKREFPRAMRRMKQVKAV